MSRNKGAKTGNEKQAALDALAAAVIKAFNSGALDSRSVVIAAQKEDRIVLRGCVHQVFGKNDSADFYGNGSTLHKMASAALDADPGINLFCVGI